MVSQGDPFQAICFNVCVLVWSPVCLEPRPYISNFLWTCRCACMRHLIHSGTDNVITPLSNLIEVSRLTGNIVVSESRVWWLQKCYNSTLDIGCCIYHSDGASRIDENMAGEPHMVGLGFRVLCRQVCGLWCCCYYCNVLGKFQASWLLHNTYWALGFTGSPPYSECSLAKFCGSS